MDIDVVSSPIHETAADAILIFLYQNSPFNEALNTLDAALGGLLREVTEAGDLTGKSSDLLVLYPRGVIPAQRIIAVGLGEAEEITPDTIRRAAAQGIKKARDMKARTVTALLPDHPDVNTAAEALTEGTLLALYSYHGQKSKEKAQDLPEKLTLFVTSEQDIMAAQQGVKAGEAVAAGVKITRDLVNLPPNICTPAHMAQVAEEVAQEAGLKIEVLKKKQIEALGMGALLGVAQGSDDPPRFIILEHNADKAEALDTIVLVGKGVTFDTGGYSIKTTDGMVGMKADMAGGGAVIGAMRVIAALDVPLHVVGLIPAVDNMISGHAFRPQDVLKASNGITIEIISTDAEGRLILADALVFAARYKPAAVVDIATLTGACMVALGTAAGGLFSTDDTLRDALMQAAERTHEKIWPLPMFAEYDKLIESNTADIKNTGGRYGGASIAAVFLKHFVDYPAWAHIDMAGMAGIEGVSGSENPYVPAKGATGYGARLLADFVRHWK